MIEARGLTKVYRTGLFGNSVEAAHEVSFQCARGEAVALVGSNGAGKTTTLRMLATAIRPTSGTGAIDGCDLVADATEVRRRLGFLSTNTGLYLRMTPRELLRHYARLYGLANPDVSIARVVEAMQIGDFLDRPCDKLSTGMKQRVNLARTLLHDPSVLILDEPTLGLDIDATVLVLETLEECLEKGKTILLSTHVLGEVSRLCTRVIVMAHGRVVLNESIVALENGQGLEPSVREAMRATA